MKNPFRDASLARMFDAALKAGMDNFSPTYIVTKKPGKYGPNLPRRGSSDRHSFWNGWNGAPVNWDSSGRQSYAYAAYKAGEAFRKLVTNRT